MTLRRRAVRALRLARAGVLRLGATGFPFLWPAVASSAASRRRRRALRRIVMERWPAPLRPFAMIAMVLGWPIGAWVEAGAAIRGDAHPSAGQAAGKAAGQAAGKAAGKTARETAGHTAGHTAGQRRRRVWALALRHNLTPHDILMWRLDQPDGPPCSDDWLSAHECKRLFARLPPASAKALAGNKAAFAAFCLKHGLRQPVWLGHWRGGQALMALPGPLPDAVVVKPTWSNNAYGQELWTRDGADFVRGAQRLSEPDLVQHIADTSDRMGEVIAQACLVLHPALSARGLTGSPTARLLTAQRPDGAPFVLDAYFSTPPAGRFASNDGIGAYHGVDVTRGRLTPSACTYVPAWTGPPLVGMALPGWADAVAQALRGHGSFPEPTPILAWDIGFTADGPALIEVNTGIDQTYEQAIRGAPAFAGPLGPLIDAWFSHRGI